MWKLVALTIGLMNPLALAIEPDWRSIRTDAGVLPFAVVEPPAGVTKEAVLLLLPPGGQDREMAARAIELYVTDAFGRKGWTVISPALPDRVDGPFHGMDGSALRALIDHLRSDYEGADGALHLAGVSNGGKSAFRLAIDHPERFQSLIAMPGFPPTDADMERLPRLADLPVALFVGGNDEHWATAMGETRDRLLDGISRVSPPLFVSYPDEGHVPPSLDGATLLLTLEDAQRVSRARAAARQAVATVLDDFHDAAAKADGERYFGHFAPGAVFLGTDASERWTVADFRAYAEPYFSKGQGWTYVARERHVELAGGRDGVGDAAWFDERLDNEKYGEVRGSGVLRRIGRRWLITQYNLAFPVPNDLAADLVERIRAQAADDAKDDGDDQR